MAAQQGLDCFVALLLAMTEEESAHESKTACADRATDNDHARRQLAQDVTLPEHPRPQAFRGMTLAWNCRTPEEVDAVLDFAVSKGASLLKAAHKTDYGGYSGYFADPDNHPWEVVVAPNIEVGDDRRIHLPD
jgi:uncharacterized glyoxalase superfamily protein PhnB